MKKFTYRLFAWSLATLIFWSFVFPVERHMTLPAGLASTTLESHQAYLGVLVGAYPSGYHVELLGFTDVESDVWGWTTWDEEREVYQIHYFIQGPLAFVRETILHEYAHVLVWDAVQDTPHDSIYWGAYGNLYRFTIDE